MSEWLLSRASNDAARAAFGASRLDSRWRHESSYLLALWFLLTMLIVSEPLLGAVTRLFVDSILGWYQRHLRTSTHLVPAHKPPGYQHDDA